MTSNYFEDVDHADQVADEVLEERQAVPDVEAYMSDALKRIEQAQLYKTLINHQIFAPGSASPEILAAVEREIREFAIHRLEVLVGMKPEVAPAAQAAPFSDEQVEALRSLADRVLKRGPAEPANHAPKINEVQHAPEVRMAPSSVPAINPVPAPKIAGKSQPARKNAPSTGAQGKPAAPSKPRTRRKTENVSQITGEDLSQAVGTTKPMPMPSPQEMAIRMAASVQKDMAGMGGSEKGSILIKAIGMSQKINENVKED